VHVRVRGFLTFREAVGTREVDLEDGATLRTLFERLAGELDSVAAQVYAPSDGLRRGVAVLVNGRHYTHTRTGLETTLCDGDEVDVFPPLAGG